MNAFTVILLLFLFQVTYTSVERDFLSNERFGNANQTLLEIFLKSIGSYSNYGQCKTIKIMPKISKQEPNKFSEKDIFSKRLQDFRHFLISLLIRIQSFCITIFRKWVDDPSLLISFPANMSYSAWIEYTCFPITWFLSIRPFSPWINWLLFPITWLYSTLLSTPNLLSTFFPLSFELIPKVSPLIDWFRHIWKDKNPVSTVFILIKESTPTDFMEQISTIELILIGVAAFNFVLTVILFCNNRKIKKQKQHEIEKLKNTLRAKDIMLQTKVDIIINLKSEQDKSNDTTLALKNELAATYNQLQDLSRKKIEHSAVTKNLEESLEEESISTKRQAEWDRLEVESLLDANECLAEDIVNLKEKLKKAQHTSILANIDLRNSSIQLANVEIDCIDRRRTVDNITSNLELKYDEFSHQIAEKDNEIKALKEQIQKFCNDNSDTGKGDCLESIIGQATDSDKLFLEELKRNDELNCKLAQEKVERERLQEKLQRSKFETEIFKEKLKKTEKENWELEANVRDLKDQNLEYEMLNFKKDLQLKGFKSNDEAAKEKLLLESIQADFVQKNKSCQLKIDDVKIRSQSLGYDLVEVKLSCDDTAKWLHELEQKSDTITDALKVMQEDIIPMTEELKSQIDTKKRRASSPIYPFPHLVAQRFPFHHPFMPPLEPKGEFARFPSNAAFPRMPSRKSTSQSRERKSRYPTHNQSYGKAQSQSYKVPSLTNLSLDAVKSTRDKQKGFHHSPSMSFKQSSHLSERGIPIPEGTPNCESVSLFQSASEKEDSYVSQRSDSKPDTRSLNDTSLGGCQQEQERQSFNYSEFKRPSKLTKPPGNQQMSQHLAVTPLKRNIVSKIKSPSFRRKRATPQQLSSEKLKTPSQIPERKVFRFKGGDISPLSKPPLAIRKGIHSQPLDSSTSEESLKIAEGCSYSTVTSDIVSQGNSLSGCEQIAKDINLNTHSKDETFLVSHHAPSQQPFCSTPLKKFRHQAEKIGTSLSDSDITFLDKPRSAYHRTTHDRIFGSPTKKDSSRLIEGSSSNLGRSHNISLEHSALGRRMKPYHPSVRSPQNTLSSPDKSLSRKNEMSRCNDSSPKRRNTPCRNESPLRPLKSVGQQPIISVTPKTSDGSNSSVELKKSSLIPVPKRAYTSPQPGSSLIQELQDLV